METASMKPEYFELSQIEGAILSLYNADDEPKRSSANRLLISAQYSQSAWNFVWDLLDPNKSEVIQFFGAHVLCYKLTYQWQQLPSDQHMMLWSKMGNALSRLNNGPRSVVRLICTSLGLFALRAISNTWPNVVADMIQSFQNSSGNYAASNILRTLTAMAEKFSCIVFGNNEKIALRAELKKNIHQVLNVTQHFISPSVELELAIQAMECASVWIELGVPLPEVESIVVQLLQISHHHVLCEKALQSLTKILTQPDCHKFESTILNLLKEILKLEVLLEQSLKDNDEEQISVIFDLFISVATTHCRLFLDTLLTENSYTTQILRLYELALMCSNASGQYPRDESYSEHAFNFWFTLKDDFAASKPEHMQVQLKYITPVFDKLVDILLRKSMLPLNPTELSASDMESLRTYREDVGDTLAHCYRVLGSSMLEKMETHLRVYLELAHRDPAHWPQLEACLHAYKFLAEDVDYAEEVYIPRLITCLPQVPLTNTKVVCMALDTLGCFSEWLYFHPQYLQHVVPLLVTGLRSPQFAFYGTMALKDLTRDSPEAFRPHAPHMLQISQEVLHSGALSLKDSTRLMFCMGRLLSLFPNNMVITLMDPIITPYMKELGELCIQGKNPQTNTLLKNRLEMFSQLFSSVVPYSVDQEEGEEGSQIAPSTTSSDQQHSPIIFVLQSILPMLKAIVDRWQDDWEVLEEVCRVIKQAVSALFDGIAPVMMDVLTLLVHLYKTHPLPIALKVAEQFLVMFGSDEIHKQSMESLIAVIVEITLSRVNTDLTGQSEILACFLALLTQVMKKHMHLMVQPNINIENLFKFAMVSLGVLDVKMAREASHFIVNMVTKSREHPVLLDLVNIHGETLVLQIIKCLSESSPKGSMELYADVLLVMNKKYCDYLARWLHKLLLAEEFPIAHVKRERKEKFISSVLRIKSNKSKMADVIKEFSLLCRGLVGMELGREIMTAI